MLRLQETQLAIVASLQNAAAHQWLCVAPLLAASRAPDCPACTHSARSTVQIFEKHPTTIKNYGIWVRYMSRTGFHNAYKEYRDVTLNGAVEQMYQARVRPE